jgi:hypothetical protein
MGCQEGFAIWNPVPAGSKFCAQVDGTGDDFFVNVEISNEAGPPTTFGTAALIAGIEMPLASEGYGALATVRIGVEAATVNLRMFIKAAEGSVKFECTTQHATPKTTTNILVTIVPA